LDLNRIVWLDVETGGTDPIAHQITQIAAIATDCEPTLNVVGEEFERKIELVDGKWEQDALDMQAYSEGAWAEDAIPIYPAMADLRQWCMPFRHERKSKKGRTYKVCHMAAFNGRFDADFVRATADRNDLWMPLTTWTGGVFDVLQLVKWFALLRGVEHKSYKLEDLCAEYGIPPFGAHDALADVKAMIALTRIIWRETAQLYLPAGEEKW